MSKLLVFGFHSINEFGQANVGAYTQAHPFSALIIGFSAVFAILLFVKLILK